MAFYWHYYSIGLNAKRILHTYYHWFKDIEFKVSIAASNSDGHMVAHDLSCHHGHGLTLSRVHLTCRGTTRRHEWRLLYMVLCSVERKAWWLYDGPIGSAGMGKSYLFSNSTMKQNMRKRKRKSLFIIWSDIKPWAITRACYLTHSLYLSNRLTNR